MAVKSFTQKERDRAVALAATVGVANAAMLVGCSQASVYCWLKAASVPMRRGPAPQFDHAAAIRRAEEIGVNAAARELGVHACQISRWRRRAGLPPIGASAAAGRTVYPQTFVRSTVRLAARIGTEKAALQRGVAKSTVLRWRRMEGA
ncbi:hypothetical protein [Brevundimonas naejangsanensis]|uniref:hypothetical protein n=1 Tax=Brevundimonas naejangsanensis TaxID=588932 RepID=UPI0026EBDDE2|nr:hypothetical protein [Brevundimonas naejangsanensis]